MSDYKDRMAPFTLTSNITNLVAEISGLTERLIVTQELIDTPFSLRKENRIKTIQSSLAIEQNTLTLEQVTAVLNGKKVLVFPLL